MRAEPPKESDLFAPIRDYLDNQGYRVNAEVKNCDVTATRDDDLIVVELKVHFNATLLIQASDRQRVADAVYVGLPYPKDLRRHRNWRGMCHLLKRLELGLIVVHFLKSGPRAEVAFHPGPYNPRRQHKKRRAIIREIHDRSGEYNTGGSTRKPLVTAYREEAIHIACLLEKHKTLSPAELKSLGAGDRTQNILARNHYGWFDRVARGVYRLHPDGNAALQNYPEVVAYFSAQMGGST